MVYKCVGTEAGDYYFVYDNTNYQFAMPTIEANDLLEFDTTTHVLSLNGTAITTTEASTGTLITLTQTPSPDYSQDIVVVEGECSLNITNKNWFDKKSTVWKRNNGSTFDISDTDTSSTRIRTSSFPIKGGQTYKLSGYPSNTVAITAIRTYDFSKTKFDGVSINGNVFTLSEKVAYINILFGGSNFDASINTLMENSNIQIEVYSGSSSSTYIDHKGQTYPITLPTGMFLGSIGTASNYIYGTKDNWKLHSGLDKVVFDENTGNLTIVNEKNNSIYFEQTTVRWKKATSSNVANIMCNILQAKSAGSMYATDVEGITTGNPTDGPAKTRFNLLKTRASSVTELKTWLGTHNMIIYGELNEPTETDITDTTLIQQLNNIADNLLTYKGETIVFTTNENLNPNVQFDYMVNPFASIEARLDLLEG